MKRILFVFLICITPFLVFGQTFFDKIKKDAEAGDAESQCMLGTTYRADGDNQQALYWFKKSAIQGNAIAQYSLWDLYYTKEDSTFFDEKQAFYWLKKSAEQGGMVEAQYNLGLMYYNGEGTSIDKKQAFFWFKKSAEDNDADAQFLLGYMYYKGEGVLLDKKQAAFWIKKANENGNNEAKKIWEEWQLSKY